MPLAVSTVHNLKGEEWWRNLEVEVKNVSDRPIFFFEFTIELPDTCANRDCWGVVLRYGRRGLWELTERPGAEDIPLRPGEVYSFNVPEDMRPTFSDRPAERRQRVLFRFGHISFVDGTGIGMGGVPLPLSSP